MKASIGDVALTLQSHALSHTLNRCQRQHG